MNNPFPDLSDLAPGELRCVTGISAEDYHAFPAVSQSLLKDFAGQPSPAHFQARAPREATEAMQLGTIFHTLTLEPEHAATAYHLRPAEYPDAKKDGDKPTMKPWHGAATWCKNWLASHADRPVITTEDEAAIFKMLLAVRELQVMRGLLEIGTPETSWFKLDEETGQVLKGRTDLVASDAANVTWLADLKKVRRGGASETEFAKTCVDYGYHVQAAFYLDLTGASRFLFCAVEDEAPFAANLIELDSEAIALGRRTYRNTLNAYAACVRTGEWPGYPPGIKRVNLPPWAYKANV